MAGWVEVACLVTLNNELWKIAPARDMGASGTIGDQAHAGKVSDHNPDETGAVPIHDADKINEVHALDVDVDLRQPGLSMRMVVDHIWARCKSGAEKRLRYIIFDHQIAEASNGWEWRPYTGTDPHTGHAHFSASYVTALEADTRSWTLEDIPVALTSDDKKWISTTISAEVAKIWSAKLDIDTTKDGTNLQPAGSILAYSSSEHHAIEANVELVEGKVDALAGLLRDLAAALTDPPPAG
jgi:hypothetical protein